MPSITTKTQGNQRGPGTPVETDEEKKAREVEAAKKAQEANALKNLENAAAQQNEPAPRNTSEMTDQEKSQAALAAGLSEEEILKREQMARASSENVQREPEKDAALLEQRQEIAGAAPDLTNLGNSEEVQKRQIAVEASKFTAQTATPMTPGGNVAISDPVAPGTTVPGVQGPAVGDRRTHMSFAPVAQGGPQTGPDPIPVDEGFQLNNFQRLGDGSIQQNGVLVHYGDKQPHYFFESADAPSVLHDIERADEGRPVTVRWPGAYARIDQAQETMPSYLWPKNGGWELSGPAAKKFIDREATQV
jgi:hypothetical protein